RHLAHAQGGAARDALALVVVDVDPLGAQLPPAVPGRAGGIGGAVQRALRALHLDAFGAAVAAPLGQLVGDVVDAVGVGLLVALQALGHQAHARILVAHPAAGHVGRALAAVLEVVGAQELVAAPQGHVARVLQALAVHAGEAVAGDVGRQAGAVGGVAGGGLRVRE